MYDEKKHQSALQESRTVEISTINNHNDCDSLYYAVIGKLIVGAGEVKTLDGNRRVEEDNIIDEIG